ncbi:MAG: hypothetical protein O7F76_12190 [Planctomycetota bacterium]|nr:hypothetical protein [Planctomycetota bacterium]
MKQGDQKSGTPDEGPQRRATSDSDKVKARKWFGHAKTVAGTKNYDYAVELYVNGLALWPDSVEEGLRQLRVVATARRLNGGKPAGFLESKKRPTGGRNAIKALNNALYLFGKAPSSLPHMEQILQAAAHANCDRTVQWIAPVMVEALVGEKKLPEKRYAEACDAMESAARLSDKAHDFPVAVDILQACTRTAQIWTGYYPNSTEGQRAYSSASSNLTIAKGKFGSGEDFRESLKDAEEQRDLRDGDKLVRSADRDAHLIEKARREWEANPDVPAKLIGLAEILTRRENDDAEKEAIDLLEAEYAKTKSYVLKVKADDIVMRQLHRQGRKRLAKFKADPKNPELRKAAGVFKVRQNKKEIAIFRERAEHYPTDLRVKFNLATRLFKMKEIDEAIPLFQQAQSDGRHRNECRLYLGRCFHEKDYQTQAIETLTAALEDMETSNNETAKDLHYWLARAQEASENTEEARKTYGYLIQLDYNYRDARKRLEGLNAPPDKPDP